MTNDITVRDTAESTTYVFRSEPRAVASRGEFELAHIPQPIPEAELLFWTPEWRALVTEGREALATGESVQFSNFKDLATWLLTPEDDD